MNYTDTFQQLPTDAFEGVTSSDTITITSNNTSLSTSSVFIPPMALTDEETKELEVLQNRIKEEQQEARRLLFRRLPSSIRQGMVDAIYAEKILDELDGLYVPSEARYNLLKNKANGFFPTHNGFSASSCHARTSLNKVLDEFREYFTDEEMLDMDASIRLEELIKE